MTDPDLPDELKNLRIAITGDPGSITLQEAIQLAHFHLHGDIPFL